MSKLNSLALCFAALLLTQRTQHAQAAVFSETFDSSASSSNFLVTQVAGSVDTITFGYDYSANGIPEAPSTPGGAAAQRGVFLQVNKPPAPATTGAINGVNLTAAAGGLAINFGGNITMTFDMWLNYNTAGSGTTEQALFGINTDGAGVNSRTGATQTGADGVWYHIATEGGYGATSTTPNSRDYVNYINNSVPTSGRLDNNEAPFPTLFQSPPAAIVGTPGNQWVRVKVEESGGNVVMSFNDVVVFNVANTGPTDGSIFIGYQDPFSGSLADANSFALYDNLVVVPEASSLLFGAVAATVVVGGVFWRRRSAKAAA